MSEIQIVPFSDQYNVRWDQFVLNESINGTILQTRAFLNYHPKDRFIDNSLVILKGNEIISVIPANLVMEDGVRKILSHTGSTFGGIIINKRNMKVSVMKAILDKIDEYCKKNAIDEIHLKMTSQLYSKRSSELIDYMLFHQGYSNTMEMGYYIDFNHYNLEIQSNFSSSVRRHYRASEKNGLKFRELENKDEILCFYNVLIDNYKKFDKNPVHTLEELYQLKKIIKEQIRFFGVFKEREMVASSMIFDFDHRVFHTQYLAARSSFSKLYVNEFLYTNLILTAKREQFPFLSFGTATLDRGNVLNYNLAQYKEQYGTDQYVNRTYHRVYTRGR